MSRDYQPVEARLLSEYLAVTVPAARIMQRVRVGSLHPSLDIPGLTPEERRLAGVWRRWVDAIVDTGHELILVEAAVNPDPGDVSQLDLYMRLFPGTPELQEFAGRPVRGLLVYAIDDPTLRAMAAERGFTVAIYRPRWVDAYVLTLAARRRRAPLTVQ
jgi:hypothetical protein